MEHPLQAWRDTLDELGVIGLVRTPVQAAEAEPPAPSRSPSVRPTPARPVPAPAPAAKPPKAYVPPTDAQGCPPVEVVAATSTLSELQAAIQGCLACPLGPGRLKFVFGEGNPKARLLFVGEGPGRDEDLQGRPFVGKAGELLDKMIGAIGLKREEVYIANVVKCRPPDNRTPTPEEAHACLGYLRRQIELIGPSVIVTLGATPLRELVGVAEGITRVRGQWKRVNIGGRDIPVMPTFHPAYVLRQYTQDVRRAVWEDLKAAKEWADKAAGA
ncbi:uracil-DNA glycosylase family protein [Geothrix sp. PMB-07]|uniref:uracil-DNA glycosylase n=1 Tax=Geothrix sp. PMB-07 TaxID=3068640 RepID=UPI00274199A2|nr:uracil-DNA glycosylase [Geothrix sp. PMB-07]WLT32206.1 uracil-DNA glycosylase [Geothrix sp. PMB-07]